MAKQFHTEGYIKEITVNGKAITVKIAPSDEFSFGPDGLVQSGCKKIVLVDEYEQCDSLAGLNTMFAVEDVDLNALYAMKKDRTKLRVFVDAPSNPTSSAGTKSPTSVPKAESTDSNSVSTSTDQPDAGKKEVSQTTYKITSITIL